MKKKEHMKTIEKVEKFIKEKDFEGLKVYIEKRKTEIEFEENNTNAYIDELIRELK